MIETMDNITLDLFREHDATPAIFKGDKWDRLSEILKNDPDLNFKEGDSPSMSERIFAAIEGIKDVLLQGYTFQIAYSGGKDSSSILLLVLFAMVNLVRSGKGHLLSPYSWIGHTDTGIENPEVRYLADKTLAALQRFIQEENLPLTVAIARPGLTSSWPGRILTGRGLPTFVVSSARQCSNDLKVLPAKKMVAKMKQRIPKGPHQKICLLLGSRDAESSIRAGNIAKRGGSDVKLTVMPDGSAELYPVKNWFADNIWEFLLACGSEESPLLPLPGFLPNFKEIAELYRAATGECIWGGSQPKKSEACGARFGCAFCTAAGTDDSMEEMLYDHVDGERVLVERYAYMAGLNRVQRYLIKTQWDWSLRHPIGRTIYADGFIRLKPDVYKPSFLRRLLHVCCSLDYAEQERAVETQQKLFTGELEDNEHNRRMSKPQFRIVSPEAIVHIAFLWSFHHFVETPYEAIRIYRDVWRDGVLDLLDDEPDLIAVPRTTIDEDWWIKVPRWGDGSLVDGLADPMSVMTYFDGQEDERAARLVNTWDGPRHVVTFADDNEMTIDEEAANWIIWEEFPRLWEQVKQGMHTNTDAARYFMRMGAVALAKGMTGKYHQMMQRGQTLAALGLTGDKSMLDVLMNPDVYVISKKTYYSDLARKFKREWYRVKRLVYLNLVIQMNLHHGTALGLAIEQQLRQEKAETHRNHLGRLANQVETMGMSILAVHAQWLVAPHSERKFGQAHCRKWRKTIFGIVQALSKKDRTAGRICDGLRETLNQIDTLTRFLLSCNPTLC